MQVHKIFFFNKMHVKMSQNGRYPSKTSYLILRFIKMLFFKSIMLVSSKQKFAHTKTATARDHLCIQPTNERRRIIVILCLIGWAHT